MSHLLVVRAFFVDTGGLFTEEGDDAHPFIALPRATLKANVGAEGDIVVVESMTRSFVTLVGISLMDFVDAVESGAPEVEVAGLLFDHRATDQNAATARQVAKICRERRALKTP